MLTQNFISCLLFLTGLGASYAAASCKGKVSKIKYDKIDVNGRGPMELWLDWYNEAKTRPENIFPESVSMSTVQKNGHPAARTLLLRGYNESGFKIYTDYNSPKAQELAENNWTALVFLWVYVPMGEKNATGTRQVRVEGVCSKLSRKENMEYFESQPVEDQIRAVVQRQSKCINGKRKREILKMTRKLLAQAQCPGFKVPFPEDYGGYFVSPQSLEFYENEPKTIGDRIKFIKRKDISNTNGKNCRRYVSKEDWIFERLEV